MDRKQYVKPRIAMLFMEQVNLLTTYSDGRGTVVGDTDSDGYIDNDDLNSGGGADPGTALTKENIFWGD